MTSEQPERMTDEQIQWCIDYCRRLSDASPIIKTGLEYASIAQTITQLRTDLTEARSQLAEAVEALKQSDEFSRAAWDLLAHHEGGDSWFIADEDHSEHAQLTRTFLNASDTHQANLSRVSEANEQRSRLTASPETAEGGEG